MFQLTANFCSILGAIIECLNKEKSLRILSPSCEALARKCSVAVDFPKSGEPSEPLEAFEKVKVFPDFAEKPHRKSYRSERLNGQIYRLDSPQRSPARLRILENGHSLSDSV